MRKPKWLERFLRRRASERDFKRMMAANTKTLPTGLSFRDLNAGRVITGEMPDPSGMLGEDGDQMRADSEATGGLSPDFDSPEYSPAYARQLELEREWVASNEESEAATDLTDKAKVLRVKRVG